MLEPPTSSYNCFGYSKGKRQHAQPDVLWGPEATLRSERFGHPSLNSRTLAEWLTGVVNTAFRQGAQSGGWPRGRRFVVSLRSPIFLNLPKTELLVIGDAAVEMFLADDSVIDWKHRDVLALARIFSGSDGPVAVAARCFKWVRDQVRHSGDHGDQKVTCIASEVLRHRTGLCYAKSHLLAALLRANGIPCGFAYQRLSMDGAGPPYSLHGLNAIFLPESGWYRVDARGNRPEIETRFDPPVEAIAFQARLKGETTFDNVWPQPLPVVVQALRQCETVGELLTHLPDWDPRN